MRYFIFSVFSVELTASLFATVFTTLLGIIKIFFPSMYISPSILCHCIGNNVAISKFYWTEFVNVALEKDRNSQCYLEKFSS